MWFDLYLLSAVIAAVGVWLISPHFQAYDPPTDAVRGLCCAIAGILWPIIAVGAAQIMAVRYVARRIRTAHSTDVNAAPVVARQEVSLTS
ncbi:hypothetical protein ACQ86B_00125 [Mycolicibacterium aichiense]|uniref:hypothetical protein n=1 Tax=Mycolicibacterium aichiense TaxID=1799 RepID=UPI003D667B7E